jgi:Asp-tRNA(Asn)/Glu-tRNA(Gln) amidotransferase A subunit family amidase
MLRELKESVGDGLVSAVELVQRALDRIERDDARIHAVVALRAEEALAEARALDDRARRGESLGPLAGVPFLVKDSMDLAGLTTTHGSLLYEDAPPAERDSVTVGRLRAAGAIAVGKTNLPEFCFEGFSANRVFGVTGNPWGLDWSPGGSSGGSAAAMAAGMIPFATASDGGGSVRIPAAFCGLYGIKPTLGVIGRDPIPAWIDFSTDGPLALTMADLRLLLEVMAGPAPGDPSALPAPLSLASGTAKWPARLLAAPRLVEWGPLPDAIGALFEDAVMRLERVTGLEAERLSAADVLADAGADVNADDDWWTIAATEQAHELGRDWIERNAESFHSALLSAMRHGLSVSVDEYMAARRRRFDYVKALDELLGESSVIVCPTMPSEGYGADGCLPGSDRPGTAADTYNTQVQNVTGHPALTVPAGVSPNGLPFGLQLTAPRFRDDLLLDLGDAWEASGPGGVAPAPGYAPFWEE